MKRLAILLVLAGCATTRAADPAPLADGSGSAAPAAAPLRLFDGATLSGWELKAVHGGQGGIWTVEDGVIVANQQPDHGGGLLGTTRHFSDFEVSLEFDVDDPADTGLFLRTPPNGLGYQVTIDVSSGEGADIGSLYSSGNGGYLAEYGPWRDHWKPGEWNTLRARITGQPAHITVWLNGAQTIDYVDTEARYPREGYIGLQVHAGAGAWGADSRARFRNITVTEIVPE